jgi:hypothetical protein
MAGAHNLIQKKVKEEGKFFHFISRLVLAHGQKWQ